MSLTREEIQTRLKKWRVTQSTFDKDGNQYPSRSAVDACEKFLEHNVKTCPDALTGDLEGGIAAFWYRGPITIELSWDDWGIRGTVVQENSQHLFFTTR